MGDGVLAYFDYPRAFEDAAERAVRAGLAAVEAVGRLTAPDRTSLAARVGIATGLVVVGELIGEGAAQEQAVVGDTPNLAARLQALGGARGNAHVKDAIRGEEVGPLPVRGLAHPVATYRVVDSHAAEPAAPSPPSCPTCGSTLSPS